MTALTPPALKSRHPEGTYKTRPCANWLKVGSCPYGRKCQFAHGAEELRAKQRPRAQETPTQAAPATLAAVVPAPHLPSPQAPSPRAVMSVLTADTTLTDFATRCYIAEPAHTQGLPSSKIGGPPLAKRDVSFATKTVCGVACLALEEDSMTVLEALLSSGMDSESDQPPPPPSVDWHGLQQVWLQSSVGQRSTASCPRDTNTWIAAGAA